MTDLSDVATGDLITAARQNLINDYIEDGTHRVKTLSISIGSSGIEVIDSSGNVKPIKLQAYDSNGILFYASDGVTQIAKLDDSGNLYIKGRVIKL